MTFFQSIILGAVQGLTEFIPVSSSGHLIIFPKILGWKDGGLAFDTTLHLGTLAALIIFFRKDLADIISAFFKRGPSVEKRIGTWLLISTFPAGIAALVLGDFLEATFRGMLSVAVFLTVGSILMFFANKVKDKIPAPEIRFKNVFTAGLFQCLALFSGVSRSGATISGGLLSGLNREQSARVSFLLSIPIIAAAGLSQLPDALGSGIMMSELLGGFISSAFFGYLAVSALIKYLKTHGLGVFIIYRLLLAALLFFLA